MGQVIWRPLPKEARGHATSDSTHIDSIVLSVTKSNVSARAHESWCQYVYRPQVNVLG